MSCMCGDIQCWSCGPAQGNSRCIACGVWADEGCDCTDEQIARAESERWGELQGEVDELIEDQLREDEYNRAAKTI